MVSDNLPIDHQNIDDDLDDKEPKKEENEMDDDSDLEDNKNYQNEED